MRKPDCYLGSSEYSNHWIIPRACWLVRRVTWQKDGDHRLIRVAPPIRGEAYGKHEKDLQYFIVGPHYDGYKFWKLRWPILNLIYYPFQVYVYLIREDKQPTSDDDPIVDRITGDELEIVAWADLCRSFTQALKVMLDNWKGNLPGTAPRVPMRDEESGEICVEPTQPSNAAVLRMPDCYLSSGDNGEPWDIPRACWMLKRFRFWKREHRLIKVIPPIRGESCGRPGQDLHYFIVAPHSQGDYFWMLMWPLLNLIKYPFPVYIYTIAPGRGPMRDDDPSIDTLTEKDLTMMAWGDLCRSFRQAVRVMIDLRNQNLDKPREH